MKPRNINPTLSRLVLFFTALLTLAACVGPAPTKDATPAEVRLVFPQRDVVLTPTFETFPVILSGGAVGETTWVRVDDSLARPVTIEGSTTQIDIPVNEILRRVSVLDSNFQLVGAFRIEIVSQETAEGMLLEQKQEEAEEHTGEAGSRAPDLLTVAPYFDDQPPYIFTKEDFFCLTDVDLHRPISQDPAEPLVPEIRDFAHGAWTLRNDDADWIIADNVTSDTLPIASVQNDIAQSPNGNENDLVRMDAFNLLAIPDMYLFAFPLDVEDDRDLDTPVNVVRNGRQATAQELRGFTDARKTAASPDFAIPVGAGTTSIWLEGRLGGRYRLVLGAVPAGTPPDRVTYDRANATTTPPLGCTRQATLTVAVVDIFQGNTRTRRRLTAFDVYWGARPHFLAEVWPPQGEYEWAAPYRIGAMVRTVPGTAVTGEVALMNRDRTEREPRPDARQGGHDVHASGPAGADNKARFEGGIRVERRLVGNVPTINTASANRYPERISVAYTVQGERLVRPEPLEVILPRLRIIPPAVTVEGTPTTVQSTVQYQIEDSFGRLITAHDVDDYIDFYGAGLKAWEALGTGANTQEGGRRNDTFEITTVGLGLPRLPVGTAQRSQAGVLANRMTAAGFTDTLAFTARGDPNDRFQDWRVWANAGTRAQEAARRQEATARVRAYNQAAGNPAALAPLRATDGANTTAHPVLSIPQDVILQLRSGDDREDLMVLEGNRLAVFAPHFSEGMPTANQLQPFHFHLRFEPGGRTSQIVDINRRRTPP